MNKNLFLLGAILLSSCTSSQNDKRIPETANLFYSIDFSSILENKTEIPISEIAENIEYILLESTDESVLGRIREAKFTKDYIFIQAYGNPLLAQFDFKGNFLRYIGKIGKGPEEYDLIREFSLDEKSGLIYIQPNWIRNILVYTFNGKFVKTLKINRDERSIVWCRDSSFICYSEPSVGNEEYVFTEINSSGQILQTIQNYCRWDVPPPFGRMMSYPGQHFFYRLNNRLHFKGMYNDTIYTYDNNERIIPKFSIDLGKYKLPEEMIFERGLVKRIPTTFFWTAINESSDYVFIYYSAYDTDDDMGHGSLKAGHAIYDKTTSTGKALKNDDDKMILFNDIGEWGFKNDIDGGPEFIPEYTNDSLAFHFISSLSMKKFLVSDRFLNSTPKYQMKKTALINQMSKLKVSDNDVLMVVNLK